MVGNLKRFITDTLGLSPALALIAIGLASHLLLNVLLRKPLTAPHGLLLALVIGMSIEGYEIWQAYRNAGLFPPGNDPLLTILGRHLRDVLILLSGPLALSAIGIASTRTG